MKLTLEEKTLKKYFGYKSFRPGQKEIVECINDGKDVLAVMPTGAGKSICYQVPALMASGLTLVISPLIALMKDQVENLKAKGISAAFVNSSLSSMDLYYTLDNAWKGKYKILYVAPERLYTPNFIEFSKKANISIIAIDEAHCVSQWGHDFRPSYKDIYKFYKTLKNKPVICAFTATATDVVKKDIKKLLGLKDPYEITTGFDRPNIYFRTVHTNNKIDYIVDYINRHEDKSGIVYCLTRKDVENVTKILNEKGYNVKAYHAGLVDRVRSKVQDEFLNDKIKVIVATNAFGMGIDKPNVSFVIHHSMPKNLEAYYQEAGRCGRDGNLSEAILLYNERDIKLNEFMIDKQEDSCEIELSDKEKMALKKRELNNLKRMTSYARSSTCLRQNMLEYFGEKHNGKCNNCSKCYAKSKLTDITIEAQKILSSIKRMNEKEDVEIIINVLRGINEKTNKEIIKHIIDNKYDTLSTYGILRINEKDLLEIINHLINFNYLEIDNKNDKNDDSKNILKVTSKGKDVLNKKAYVLMRTSEDYNLVKKEKIKDKNVDEVLYNLLKLTRKNIARKLRLPEFMIVQDGSLKEMAIRKPKSMKDIMDIEGMGEYKSKKFGEVFLEVIYTYNHM